MEIENEAAIYRFGGWILDTGRRELRSAEGRPVHLTTREFALLVELVRNPSRPVDRAVLRHKCSSPRHLLGSSRSVDVYIGRLRRKLNRSSRSTPCITTVRGCGYSFDVRVEVQPVPQALPVRSLIAIAGPSGEDTAEPTPTRSSPSVRGIWREG